jgi:hypothetical protein
MEPMTESTDDTSVDDTTATAGSERHWLPITLVVIATVIAVLSALTTWVRVQALDTDQWVSISNELLDEPEVTEALSLYITEQLFTQVDVAGELESLLPEDFSGLAGPIAGALRGPATDGVERILESDQFTALWERANRAAHETMVNILRDETRLESTSTADGTVTLDLGEVVTNVGTKIGIPQTALDRLPDDVGTITIFESDELASVQDAVQLLDFLSWFLFLVVVALYALAIYLARDRRRPRMLRTVGLGLLIGGVTVLLAPGDRHPGRRQRRRRRHDQTPVGFAGGRSRHRTAPSDRLDRRRVRSVDHRIRRPARRPPVGGGRPSHARTQLGRRGCRWGRGGPADAAVVEPRSGTRSLGHRTHARRAARRRRCRTDEADPRRVPDAIPLPVSRSSSGVVTAPRTRRSSTMSVT